MQVDQDDLRGIRIDKYLWHIRLTKSRNLAQTMIDTGHVRANGARVMRSSMMVQVGDVITLPRGDAVLAIRILAIPQRRGPPDEARKYYAIL